MINTIGTRFLAVAFVTGFLLGSLFFTPGLLMIRLGVDTLGIAYTFVPIASWIAAGVITFFFYRAFYRTAKIQDWAKGTRGFVSAVWGAGGFLGMAIYVVILTNPA